MKINSTSKGIITNDSDVVRQFYKEINKFPKLTREEEEELVIKYLQGDEKAFEKLVKCNLKFVVFVAKRMYQTGLDMGDLIGQGTIGLMNGIKRYDLSKNCKIITFAVHYITKSINEYIAQYSKLVTPKNASKVYTSKNNTIDKFFKQNERMPNEIELKELIRKTYNYKLSKYEDLYDITVNSFDKLEDTYFINNENNIDKKIESEHVNYLLNVIIKNIDKPMEREIIKFIYGIEKDREYSITEIAHIYDLNVVSVTRIHNKVINQLKSKYKKNTALI